MYDLNYLDTFSSTFVFKDYFLTGFEVAFVAFLVIWFLCWAIGAIIGFFKNMANR